MNKNKLFPVCKRCGRKLKTIEARERGYGDICLKKMQVENLRTPLFRKEIL